MVSFGNKFDVKVGDLLAHFSRDPAVQVIAVYLEGLDAGEGRAFFECARESPKPIIAYKGGRTEAGARSAASHTAAMSGNYEVFRAACRQAGVVLAETIDELYDRIRVFSLLAGRRPRGNRVAGVVNAGFESTVSADELKGLTQARLAAPTVERLNAINSTGLVDTSSPFLDITPMADDRTYAQFVEAVIEDEGVDCVFVAVVPHAVTLKTVPEIVPRSGCPCQSARRHLPPARQADSDLGERGPALRGLCRRPGGGRPPGLPRHPLRHHFPGLLRVVLRGQESAGRTPRLLMMAGRCFSSWTGVETGSAWRRARSATAIPGLSTWSCTFTFSTLPDCSISRSAR